MLTELNDKQLARIWRQTEVPVIFRRDRPEPVLVRLPYAERNHEWLRDDRHTKPVWNRQFKAWAVPIAWFDSVIRQVLQRYGKTYVIQLFREQQRCAPACWNAHGFHCECSCMGANHGAGHPGEAWHEVSETFAFSWGVRRYSCRLLSRCRTQA